MDVLLHMIVIVVLGVMLQKVKHVDLVLNGVMVTICFGIGVGTKTTTQQLLNYVPHTIAIAKKNGLTTWTRSSVDVSKVLLADGV